MSADNGIYILETNTKDGNKEYRVAEMAAIDNLHYDEENGKFSEDPSVMIKNARRMFEDARFFTKKADALEYADNLYARIYVEYGIQTIKVDAVF